MTLGQTRYWVWLGTAVSWNRTAVDPHGGFFVADAAEGQFRRYAVDGAIRTYFGRKGPGPGEFNRPVGAVRLASGSILAVDRFARATIFDADASRIERSYNLPLNPIEDIDLLSDSLVLVSAALDGAQLGQQLHVWNFRADSVITSFFTPPLDPATQTAAAMVAWSSAAVRADTIAAIFSVLDTIYLFGLDGRPIDKVPLPSLRFRAMTPMPAVMARNPRAPIEWLSSFDLVSRIEWTAEGDWIVQYQTVDSTGGFLYRLMHVRRDGSLAFAAVDTPRFLTMDASGSLLYFLHPDAETQDRWAIAPLR